MAEQLGNLAYYDSTRCGLVPCKVVKIYENGKIEAVVTAERGAYKRGDKVQSYGTFIVPRKMVRYRSGIPIVRTWYKWVDLADVGITAIRTAE